MLNNLDFTFKGSGLSFFSCGSLHSQSDVLYITNHKIPIATKNKMSKPLIGITLGDPGGVGPEITIKAVTSTKLNDCADFIIIGSELVLSKAAGVCGFYLEFCSDQNSSNFTGKEFKLKSIKGGALVQSPKLSLIPIETFKSNEFQIAKPVGENGNASIQYIFKGIDLALSGDIDGLVTAPINKEAIKAGGFNYPGHTELLKERTKSENVVMLMVGDVLRVAFVTSHVALKDVPQLINIDNIVSTIMIANSGLEKYFRFNRPRIAVCGLNPHSGEAGRFGKEELDIIIPAIELAREKGVNCVGPVPPDVVFFQMRKGEYDAVVALYHDQGAIPLKLLAFETGVNITLGIPIIRVSPDHGTAYDIAWQGNANPDSMIEAIRHAVMMGGRETQ